MTTDNSQGNGDTETNEEPVSAADFKKERDKNQKLFAELTDIKKKYETFANTYKEIDPDEYKGLKAKNEELERKAAEKDPAKMEEHIEKKLNKHRSEWEQKEKTLTERLAQLEKENYSLAVTDKVMTEIGGMFNSDTHKFIKGEIASRCVKEDDGTIVVKDAQGDTVYKGARPMTVKEFGELLAEEFPSMAKATGTPGGKDATPGQKTGNRSNKEPQSMAEINAMPNPHEALDRIKKENPALLQKILSSTNL
jgi:hypothetical protein